MSLRMDGFFHAGGGRGRSFMVNRRVCFVSHLRFALLLEAVFLQLLRVHGLVRALHVLLLLRTALAAFAVRTIAPVAATTAPSAATAIAASTTVLFAFLLRRTVRILRTLLRPLLLRRARRTLIRPALALRAIAIRPFNLRDFSLRLHCGLRLHCALRTLALRAIRARLMLLRRALVAPLLVASAVALLIATAVAAVALVIAPAVATSITSATSTPSAALPAALLVPFAMLFARALGTVRTRRPGRPHGGFVRRRRLLHRLLGLQPAEQAAQES